MAILSTFHSLHLSRTDYSYSEADFRCFLGMSALHPLFIADKFDLLFTDAAQSSCSGRMAT